MCWVMNCRRRRSDDHGGDDVGEREEAEESGGEGEGEERDIGEAPGGMEAGEDAEEVAVAGGGPGYAGVAEEEGEDAAEGGDHDEDGGELGEVMGERGAERGSVGLLDKDGDHGAAGGKGLLGEEFLPGRTARTERFMAR